MSKRVAGGAGELEVVPCGRCGGEIVGLAAALEVLELSQVKTSIPAPGPVVPRWAHVRVADPPASRGYDLCAGCADELERWLGLPPR